MKALFIQLPEPDPDKHAAINYVPYRSAKAAAWAEASGSLLRTDWAFLEDETSVYGSDAAIIEKTTKAEPEAVFLDLDGCNLERSIWIARKLRLKLPRTVIIAHGPEAVRNAPIFKASVFDALIEGELEAPLAEILSDLSARSLKPHYRATSPVDSLSAPDPYLAGILPIRSDRTVYVEASRGRRCTKVYERPSGPFRMRTHDNASRVVRLANKYGALEIRIIDRDPAGIADLPAFLRSIAGANDLGLPVTLNLSPEIIGEESARILLEAGVLAVDTRIDTVSDVAEGTWDRAAFERGAQLLMNAAIRIRSKLLLGLPGDDYDSIIDSFDMLGMAGLGQDARVDPLAIRPGTLLFENPGNYGIKDFLRKPPYHVLETDDLSEDDICDAIAAFEESFDVAWAAPISPRFTLKEHGYTGFADLRMDGAVDRLILDPASLSDSLTLLLDADDTDRCSRVARAALDLRRENPYTMYQLIFYSDTGIPTEDLVAKLTVAFLEPDHFYELSRLPSLDPQRSFQTRSYFATKNAQLAIQSFERTNDLETIYVLDPAIDSSSRAMDKIFETLPFIALDRDRIPFDLIYRVMSAYRDYPDLVLEASLETFDRLRGLSP